MTERMENALNHIKTSVDVDPWAMEEVERVFKGIDDAIAEIRTNQWYIGVASANVLIEIIHKHTGVGDDNADSD